MLLSSSGELRSGTHDTIESPAIRKYYSAVTRTGANILISQAARCFRHLTPILSLASAERRTPRLRFEKTCATMPNGPPRLDYSRATYFVLSSSSSAPPPLPTPSSDSPAATLRYVGPVGDGIMADEHIVALEGVPSVGGQVEPVVHATKETLRAIKGVSHVEVMQPTQRAKR